MGEFGSIFILLFFCFLFFLAQRIYILCFLVGGRETYFHLCHWLEKSSIKPTDFSWHFPSPSHRRVLLRCISVLQEDRALLQPPFNPSPPPIPLDLFFCSLAPKKDLFSVCSFSFFFSRCFLLLLLLLPCFLPAGFSS